MPYSVFHDRLLLRTLRWNKIENMYLLRTAPRRELQINGLLDLDGMDFTTFYRSFRFQKGDLEDLMEALLIPEEVMSAQRVRVSGREALCMTLRRLAYPNRLCELELFFRRHSSVISSILKETALYRNLETVTQGRTYVIYGDPAYPLRPLLYKPFGGASLRPHEVNFNKRMSSVRQAVEWGFGRVVADFAFVDFYKSQKMTRQRVGRMYKVATLFLNCRTCMYGSQVSTYFDVTPPTL
ncbi:hypothetical protein MRX96_039863 [Rhipicephalus microplus]